MDSDDELCGRHERAKDHQQLAKRLPRDARGIAVNCCPRYGCRDGRQHHEGGSHATRLRNEGRVDAANVPSTQVQQHLASHAAAMSALCSSSTAEPVQTRTLDTMLVAILAVALVAAVRADLTCDAA